MSDDLSMVLDDEDQKLIDDAGQKFPLIESFVTLQGEGLWVGRKSIFLRFGGCPRRCVFCDSMHAVDPVQVKANAAWLNSMQILDLADTLQNLPAPSVTLTGGDPCMWDLSTLVNVWEKGSWSNRKQVNVETQGDLWQSYLLDTSLVTISPKGPSAGQPKKPVNEGNIQRIISLRSMKGFDTVIKVVIFEQEDIDFLRRMYNRFSPLSQKYLTFYASVGTPSTSDALNTDWLVKRTILQRMSWIASNLLTDSELRNVRLLPQMHVLMDIP